ncbi:MAG: ATP synthase F1 subunit delta [Clostridia bacterium]|nr:ATP synthase F1 subunit delta [Clostridia bacterium]MBQ8269505.1 ATP synthase F1 subunit delta [Clostridia bacterium]MBR2324992.1 ATP synthase F1 subunit delta [Clostridia bacterium]
MIDTKEYAKALFLLAKERGALELILSDLKAACAAVKEEPDYISLLDSPALTGEERDRLIEEAFASVDIDLRSFFKILSGKHALYTLFRTADAYEALCDEEMGIIRAEAITAVALTDTQRERLALKLEKKTGKRVILKNTVDASVLGGVKLRFMGTQLDASLKSRLDSIREALQSTALGVENIGK